MSPQETEAHFRQYGGFTKSVLEQLDNERQQALGKEMTANWARHNRGDAKRTVVHSEYLEVHARRI